MTDCLLDLRITPVDTTGHTSHSSQANEEEAVLPDRGIWLENSQLLNKPGVQGRLFWQQRGKYFRARPKNNASVPRTMVSDTWTRIA